MAPKNLMKFVRKLESRNKSEDSLNEQSSLYLMNQAKDFGGPIPDYDPVANASGSCQVELMEEDNLHNEELLLCRFVKRKKQNPEESFEWKSESNVKKLAPNDLLDLASSVGKYGREIYLEIGERYLVADSEVVTLSKQNELLMSENQRMEAEKNVLKERLSKVENDLLSLENAVNSAEQSVEYHVQEKENLVKENKKLCEEILELKSLYTQAEKERDEAADCVTDMFVATKNACVEEFKLKYPVEDSGFLEKVVLKDN